jgi:hypothetical protein
MTTNDDHPDAVDPDDSCTTSESFADHGIDDGSVLIQRAYYRLSEADREFAPTEPFFESVESAFIWAYLGTTDDRGVPSHVEAALDDARILTRESFTDRPDADVRTEVLPAFYRQFAGFHCAYRR